MAGYGDQPKPDANPRRGPSTPDANPYRPLFIPDVNSYTRPSGPYVSPYQWTPLPDANSHYQPSVPDTNGYNGGVSEGSVQHNHYEQQLHHIRAQQQLLHQLTPSTPTYPPFQNSVRMSYDAGQSSQVRAGPLPSQEFAYQKYQQRQTAPMNQQSPFCGPNSNNAGQSSYAAPWSPAGPFAYQQRQPEPTNQQNLYSGWNLTQMNYNAEHNRASTAFSDPTPVTPKTAPMNQQSQFCGPNSNNTGQFNRTAHWSPAAPYQQRLPEPASQQNLYSGWNSTQMNYNAGGQPSRASTAFSDPTPVTPKTKPMNRQNPFPCQNPPTRYSNNASQPNSVNSVRPRPLFGGQFQYQERPNASSPMNQPRQVHPAIATTPNPMNQQRLPEPANQQNLNSGWNSTQMNYNTGGQPSRASTAFSDPTPVTPKTTPVSRQNPNQVRPAIATTPNPMNQQRQIRGTNPTGSGQSSLRPAIATTPNPRSAKPPPYNPMPVPREFFTLLDDDDDAGPKPSLPDGDNQTNQFKAPVETPKPPQDSPSPIRPIFCPDYARQSALCPRPEPKLRPATPRAVLIPTPRRADPSSESNVAETVIMLRDRIMSAHPKPPICQTTRPTSTTDSTVTPKRTTARRNSIAGPTAVSPRLTPVTSTKNLPTPEIDLFIEAEPDRQNSTSVTASSAHERSDQANEFNVPVGIPKPPTDFHTPTRPIFRPVYARQSALCPRPEPKLAPPRMFLIPTLRRPVPSPQLNVAEYVTLLKDRTMFAAPTPPICQTAPNSITDTTVTPKRIIRRNSIPKLSMRQLTRRNSIDGTIQLQNSTKIIPPEEIKASFACITKTRPPPTERDLNIFKRMHEMPPVKDTSADLLNDLTADLHRFEPVIPDAASRYIMTRSGINPAPESEICARFLGVAAQKVVTDILADAINISRMRGLGQRCKESKEVNHTLTEKLVNEVLGELGDH